MSPHDVLKDAGITPTIDAEKAYRLGCEGGYKLGLEDAKPELSDSYDELLAKVKRLEQVLMEIGLMARRAR